MAFTAIDFILQSEPGTTIWDWTDLIAPDLIPVALPDQERLTNSIPLFLVNGRPAEANNLGERVPIQIQAGVYRYRPLKVAALYVLFCFGHNPDCIYECWINHHSPTQKSPLSTFTQRAKLSIALFDANPMPERVISIHNSLNWSGLLNVVNEFPQWSMTAFDSVRENCPYSTKDLWLKN